jgi:hypothetical protein
MALTEAQIEDLNNQVHSQILTDHRAQQPDADEASKEYAAKNGIFVSKDFSNTHDLELRIQKYWLKRAKDQYAPKLDDKSTFFGGFNAELNDAAIARQSVDQTVIILERFQRFLSKQKKKNIESVSDAQAQALADEIYNKQFGYAQGSGNHSGRVVKKLTDVLPKSTGTDSEQAPAATTTAAATAKENRLSEQAALILTIEEILSKVNKPNADGTVLSIKDKIYKNFATIEHKSEKETPSGHFFLTNNFTKNSNMTKFFRDLPPQILSLLLPSVKLYKTFYPVSYGSDGKPLPAAKDLKGHDWRIPFDDAVVFQGGETSGFAVQSVDEILNGNGGLRSVGIKSFSYEYKGTNPAEINTNIHASIDIFFQNPMELVREIAMDFEDSRFRIPTKIKSKPLKFSYSDLVNQMARFTGPNKDVFNQQYYRIKVECGYATPSPQITRDILTNCGRADDYNSIMEAITKTKVILYLNPYQHDISFNDDSTINLKINFQATIDSMLASDDADLFSITKEVRNVRILIKEYEMFIASKNKKINDLNENDACQSEEQIKKELEEFKKDPKYSELTQEELEEKLFVRTKTFYNGIFNYLIGSEQLPSGPGEEKTISPQIYVGNFKPEILGMNSHQGKENDAKVRQAALLDGNNLISVKPLDTNSFNTALVGYTDPPASGEKDSKTTAATATDAALKELDKLAGKTNLDHEQYRIKFIFLGDILDIALECMSQIEPNCEAPRIVIGNVPIILPSKENILNQDKSVVKRLPAIYPSLAHIPISFNLFQEFMIECMVKPRKERYPVIQFIKDIIAFLIVPATSPSVLGRSTAINSTIRISSAYFSFPTFDGKDILMDRKTTDSRTNPPTIAEATITKLKNIKKNNGFLVEAPIDKLHDSHSIAGSSTEHVNYMFLVCSSRFPKNLDGSESSDINNGVFHFRMGSDSGIIKKIKFTKVNAPYQQEMAARAEGRGLGTNIKRIYNADVEMFGNNIFFPGDYIFISPNYMYNTKQLLDLNEKLGIGGYYLVTNVKTDMVDTNYTTHLKCTYAASVMRKKDGGKDEVVVTDHNC